MQSINTQRTNADSFCFSAKPFTMMGPVHILLRMRDRILAQNIYSKKGKIIIIYFYLYTCIFVYLYICILNRKLVFVYLYICTLHNYAVHCLKCSLKFHCPNNHIFLFVYLFICIFLFVYLYICIFLFVYLYICIFVYLYTCIFVHYPTMYLYHPSPPSILHPFCVCALASLW